jgi:hypothetical protein
MRKKTGEINSNAEKKLAEILKPPQMDRLNQLRVQREGVQALLRPDVAKKLGLSDEKKGKIADLLPRGVGQRGGWGRGRRGQGGGRPSRQEMQERRKKQEAEALALLTTTQQTAFEKMKGQKFEFPAPQWGGPGGRSGGRGDRPERPQRPQRPEKPST